MQQDMKKTVFATLLALAVPLAGIAQDDMYFVPTKKNVKESARSYGMPKETYYSGSSMSVDEYNRRGSYVQQLDSAGNDIITFSQEMGVYPDSIGGDFEYTRQMNRFDDYAWVDAYSEGYRDGYSSSNWGWYDSWYYDPWYYGGWYGWYRPWRYGWHYTGWYDPWYHPYHYSHWHGGWHHGWYGGGVVHRPYRGVAGTSNHGRVNRPGHESANGKGRFGGYRGTDRTGNNRVGSFGNNRNNSSYGNSSTRYERNGSGTFGNSRSSAGTGSTRSGGSFGGGGSRSGGGSFGGRR